jgi:hypothetical protein
MNLFFFFYLRTSFYNSTTGKVSLLAAVLVEIAPPVPVPFILVGFGLAVKLAFKLVAKLAVCMRFWLVYF